MSGDVHDARDAEGEPTSPDRVTEVVT